MTRKRTLRERKLRKAAAAPPLGAPQTLRDLMRVRIANPRTKFADVTDICKKVGVSRQFMSLVTKGQRKFSKVKFCLLAKVLGVNYPELQDAIDLGVLLGGG